MTQKFQIRKHGADLSGGQALVTLLFFVLISITITSAAIVMIIANAISTTKIQEGVTSYYLAESGIENALLRILRNPDYAGETLNIDTSTVVVSVTGTNPKRIVAVSTNGNFKRTVETQMTYTNGYYTISNWREI